MRVVLVGNGGREAALAWRIAQSPSLGRLIVTGHNPGWPDRAEVRPASTPAEVVEVARGADLVVVGPEGPLEQGVADALAAARIPCFGPAREAARLESSKSFAKEVMIACGVPTAASVVVDDDAVGRAEAEKRAGRGSVVVKVDGLAAGKGVFVCPTVEEALAGVREAWAMGARRLVLEDLLTGPEVSLFAISDGQRVVALPAAQDHKRLLDGDRGPNTGGMGAYVPCPLVSREQGEALADRIHLPVVQEMAKRGTPFRGLLYAGLMLTPDGPRVLEFNVRFGDPECQPLMCLWDEDVLPWLRGAAMGVLPPGRPKFASGAACCVVVAAPGYPNAPQKGIPIPEPPPAPGVVVFPAGAERGPDGRLRTSGGRVLGITGIGTTLQEARDHAYAAVAGWRFEGAQVRTDIAAGGLGAGGQG